MGLRKKVINVVKRALFLNENDNLSLLYILKRWNIRFGPYFYKKKYNTDDIILALKKMNICHGSNIFIHSAWDAFYNYEGTEDELIEALLNLIGKSGTLAMPAFPLKRKNKLFDVRKSVTAAGLLAESFRKYPNVKRSANERHSVCAVGPLADYLTKDHHHSINAFDENSPYYRLIEKNFKVISIGLPHYFIGTFLHCTKALLRHEIPYYGQLYDEVNTEVHQYIDLEGNVQNYNTIREVKISRSYYARTKYLILRYFDKSKRRFEKISNLNISSYDAKYTYERFVDLARKGCYLFTITNK